MVDGGLRGRRRRTEDGGGPIRRHHADPDRPEPGAVAGCRLGLGGGGGEAAVAGVVGGAGGGDGREAAGWGDRLPAHCRGREVGRGGQPGGGEGGD